MRIKFSPQYSNAVLTLEKQGEALIVNGDALDFSDLPDGGEYPPEALENSSIVGGVSRDGGTIQVTVLFPYQASSHFETPAPITVTKDGPITLPEVPHAAE